MKHRFPTENVACFWGMSFALFVYDLSRNCACHVTLRNGVAANLGVHLSPATASPRCLGYPLL